MTWLTQNNKGWFRCSLTEDCGNVSANSTALRYYKTLEVDPTPLLLEKGPCREIQELSLPGPKVCK